MDTFDKAEVEAELNPRLQASGIDPGDVTVKKITAIVSGYYAQRTAEILTKVRELFDRFQPDELH
jgi:hypothetical protein